ncbi:MAG: AMP-binding protein, partial [Alphaproteobacteria bacterium]|nr:AMP-binding protein [Alphaproteobacteria bacterium]
GRAASVLNSLGVRQGQRFAILCRNSFRYAELLHAGYRLGAVPVPVNYRLAPPEIAYVMENAGCTVLALEDAFTDLMDSEELAGYSAHVLIIGRSSTDSRWPVYDTMLEQAETAQLFEASEGDDALLLYTGGTTGRPKGVPLSHLNIISNALQLGFELGPRSDDVYLRVAPMFHSADLLATPYAMAGATQVFLSKFSGRAVLEAIETYRVTVTLMTPTMLIMAMQEPDIGKYDLSSLRQVIYGSSPMAVEWIRKMSARFKDVELVQAYGLTETSPILTLLHAAEHDRAMATGQYDVLKSVGRQIPGVDLSIVDSQDRWLPAGQPGEVIVRGPNVSKRYLKRPDATAESFRQGWFYTGDIGQVDDDGYLYLLDRKKDMIITGGEMVFSSEVEAALYQNPKVHECAVIGVPDETYGEALLAAVVSAPGQALTQEELIAHCRDKIGGYKIPRHYVFLDAMPKSAMDKILKTELRRIYGKKG